MPSPAYRRVVPLATIHQRLLRRLFADVLLSGLGARLVAAWLCDATLDADPPPVTSTVLVDRFLVPALGSVGVS